MEVINATGRRKSSVARVYLSEGTGKITINKKDITEYISFLVVIIEAVKTVENHRELSKSTQGRGGKNVNLRCLFPQDSSKYSMRRPSIPSFDESWKSSVVILFQIVDIIISIIFDNTNEII